MKKALIIPLAGLLLSGCHTTATVTEWRGPMPYNTNIPYTTYYGDYLYNYAWGLNAVYSRRNWPAITGVCF